MEDTVPAETGTTTLKRGLAQMLKGGVIMDVTTAEQAKIAEAAGAVSVMALERVPYDIRKEGGVARTAQIGRIEEIMEAVTIPVMAKARIGHYGEAKILEEVGVDYIDESEVLSPADTKYHIDKRGFKIPFVCGARSLEEALRRIREGAAMIRTKGEPGTGDVKEAVTHMRVMRSDIALVMGYALIEEYENTHSHYSIRFLRSGLEKLVSQLKPEQLAQLVGLVELGRYYKSTERLDTELELMEALKEYGLPIRFLDTLNSESAEEILSWGVGLGRLKLEELAVKWGVDVKLVREVAETKGLPVVNFAAGGIATPADAALCMQLGCDGVFVGSGIFKSSDPEKRAQAIVDAVAHYDEPEKILAASEGLGKPMDSLDINKLLPEERLSKRGI